LAWRLPEVENVFHRGSKRDEVVWPAEDSDFVYEISLVPDERVSELESRLLQCFYDVDVGEVSLVFPPDIVYVDYAVGSWPHEWQDA